jgi:hypothetical protein
MISSNTKILQVNLNKSAPATESALQLAIELKVDLIVVQEPWLVPKTSELDYSTTRSIAHPAFFQVLPANRQFRPRTLVYVSKNYKPIVTSAVTSVTSSDSDFLPIDISEGSTKLQLLNIYNEFDQASLGTKTLERCLYNYQLQPSTILLGDFNTHHPWWDLLAKTSPNAETLVNWIENQQLELLNSPGVGTFFRPNLARKSVLDLSLVSGNLVELIDDRQVSPDLGSDHFGILFTIRGTSTSVDFDNSQTRFNTQLADWPLFTTTLSEEIAKSSILTGSILNQLSTITKSSLQLLQNPDVEIGQIIENTSDSTLVTSFLDSAASALTSAITLAAKIAIPMQKASSNAKPWWNDQIKQLRQTMLQQKKQLAQDPSQLSRKQQYLIARNSYFSAIKHAKCNHWNQYLEKEDPKSIYKAMAYTKDRQTERMPTISGQTSFQGKCDVLRSTLFPEPPITPNPAWFNYKSSPSWE